MTFLPYSYLIGVIYNESNVIIIIYLNCNLYNYKKEVLEGVNLIPINNDYLHR